MGTNLISVDPRTDPRWEQLLERRPSDVFHSPAWLQVLGDTYDLAIQAHVLTDDSGTPQAGLPFGRIADMLGERTASLPFSDYCDPLVADAGQWDALVSPLLGERRPLVVRPLHNDIPCRDERFKLFKQARWHGKDLQADVDSLWQSLDEASRRAIRKAQKDGVTVRIAERPEMMRAFFDMHLRVRKYKYRLLAQPYRFFEQIWHHFLARQQGALLLAIHDGEIIGGTLYLQWRDTLYYKFNASARTDLVHRPNDLLTWEGIKYAKMRGLRYLDFGLSDWDQDGLIRYKRKFATDEKAISFLRYEPGREPDAREKQQRALLGRLTDLFTDASVPDSVSDRAGDLLYRFFV